MRRSLITYTPRVKPLNYSALKDRLGCQAIVGNTVFGTLPFILFCLAVGDETAPSRIVSYALGPNNPDNVETDHHTTTWAAWQATAGIRVGKFSSVTPPSDTLGNFSQLFPNAITTHLTLAFNSLGWMSIAIQKNSSVIQLRRFVSSSGDIDNREWIGFSPILFNNWLLDFNQEDPSAHDVVCFYLREGHPDTIYARFAREDFEIEHTINEGLPANIAYLVSTSVYQGLKQQMIARSANGDDITMTSDIYPIIAQDELTLELSLASGVYFEAAVPITPVDADNGMELTASLVSGNYRAVEEEDLSSDAEAVTVTVSLVQGFYASEDAIFSPD